MKYHKIRNVSLNVCTAEAKIAYNIAFAYTWDYRDEYKKMLITVQGLKFQSL